MKSTRSVYLWSRLLNTPFWTIYNMLFIIVYKELHASPWQITMMIAVKPLAALFAPYWSQKIYDKPEHLKANLVYANVLKYAPFLLFPWLDGIWFFILSFGLYMVFLRGTIPAWMEIIRRNVQGSAREKVFAVGSVVDYLGSAVLPISLGWVLDDYAGSWRWIFFVTAILGASSTFLLLFLPGDGALPKQERRKFREHLLGPWKESIALLKRRPDFARFQVGFMLGGSALIMMQTILPMFFVDTLNLSYTEIMLAVALCKGIGFALSSPFWVKLFHKINIFKFSGFVTFAAALFPVVLLFGYFHLTAVYLAWLIYGMMQAGSELSWNLSGPYFAKENNSAPYSGTNILTVGVRGCYAPFLGSLLYSLTNSATVMFAASGLCILATLYMNHYAQKEPA